MREETTGTVPQAHRWTRRRTSGQREAARGISVGKAVSASLQSDYGESGGMGTYERPFVDGHGQQGRRRQGVFLSDAARFLGAMTRSLEGDGFSCQAITQAGTGLEGVGTVCATCWPAEGSSWLSLCVTAFAPAGATPRRDGIGLLARVLSHEDEQGLCSPSYWLDPDASIEQLAQVCQNLYVSCTCPDRQRHQARTNIAHSPLVRVVRNGGPEGPPAGPAVPTLVTCQGQITRDTSRSSGGTGLSHVNGFVHLVTSS